MVRLQAGSPPQLSQLIQARRLRFLADRTNGRAYATVLRLSLRPSVVRAVASTRVQGWGGRSAEGDEPLPA